MTKEQKYPLAEPASYTPPQMEVIPLRGNSAMLIGSLQNRVDIDNTFFYQSGGTEPGNSATVWSDETTSQGWSTDNSFFADLD